MGAERNTLPVSDAVFRAVYDSPASLPGRYRWVTPDTDVRELEQLLGMPADTIHAPLWVSGDRKDCPNCGRQLSWLDIVSSALSRAHSRMMVAKVILGEQKYVNTEAPEAIPGVSCFECQAAINDLRSFKCHNWAYAYTEMQPILDQIEAAEQLRDGLLRSAAAVVKSCQAQITTREPL